MEGILEFIQIQCPCPWQGHPALDQFDQSTIQPALEHLQEWGIHKFSGQTVQCVTTLTVKNCLYILLISYVHLLSLKLEAIPPWHGHYICLTCSSPQTIVNAFPPVRDLIITLFVLFASADKPCWNCYTNHVNLEDLALAANGDSSALL